MAPARPCKICKKRKHGEIRVKTNDFKFKKNLRVSWKPMNPQDCVFENLFRIIMRTILQEKDKFNYVFQPCTTRFNLV